MGRGFWWGCCSDAGLRARQKTNNRGAPAPRSSDLLYTSPGLFPVREVALAGRVVLVRLTQGRDVIGKDLLAEGVARTQVEASVDLRGRVRAERPVSDGLGAQAPGAW